VVRCSVESDREDALFYKSALTREHVTWRSRLRPLARPRHEKCAMSSSIRNTHHHAFCSLFSTRIEGLCRHARQRPTCNRTTPILPIFSQPGRRTWPWTLLSRAPSHGLCQNPDASQRAMIRLIPTTTRKGRFRDKLGPGAGGLLRSWKWI
jgi:hypothetical protein